MPGRNFSSSDYRYGFNGKENDGSGASASSAGEGTQDYGMRIYNPSLGRFLSVDPLTKGYPELTPYQFASDSPIENIDLDGLESVSAASPFGYMASAAGFNLSAPVHVQVQQAQSFQHHLKETFKKPETYKSAAIALGPFAVAGLTGGFGFGLAMEADIAMADATAVNSTWAESTAIEFESTSTAAGSSWTSTSTVAPEYSGTSSTLSATTAAETETAVNANASVGKGMNNPKVRAAVNLGNEVHYDNLNGGNGVNGTGVGGPTELQAKYPQTQFRFARRGQAGADVEVIGGIHPSQYGPIPRWNPGNMFGDFKPATTSGNSTFSKDIKTGKLPANTQQIQYDSKTGNLK